MAAVVFNDVRTVDMTTQEIDNYRRQLGWQSKHEFKFTKNPKNIVETILQKISKYDFDIYATYIQKSNFKYVTPKLASFLDKEKVVSSINRFLQPEKTDSRKYISIIRDKIIKQQKIQCF